MGLHNEIRSAVNWNTPTVDANDSLRSGIQKMVNSKTTALLVEMDGTVIGVVTDMDLMRSVANKEDMKDTTVSECMTACELITDKATSSPCVQLHESESVENALGILSLSNLHNLVVTGEDNTKSGTVSVRDLLDLAIS